MGRIQKSDSEISVVGTTLLHDIPSAAQGKGVKEGRERRTFPASSWGRGGWGSTGTAGAIPGSTPGMGCSNVCLGATSSQHNSSLHQGVPLGHCGVLENL